MQEKKCRKTLQFERKQNRTACIVRTHIVRKIYSNLKKRKVYAKTAEHPRLNSRIKKRI